MSADGGPQAPADDVVGRLARGPVDGRWRAEAGALPPETLRALVARLDDLARCAPERVDFVTEAYLTVPDVLDPRTSGADARWAFLFATGGGRAPLEAPLRHALSVGLPPGELTWTAKAVLAQRLDATGRGEEAEALLRDVLASARGSGARVERGALANLVWMCMNRGREAEALVLARHTSARMRAARDAWGETILLDTLAHLFGWAHAWDEVRGAVEALDALEPRLDAGARRRVQVMRDRHLARIAHATGGYDEALALLERAEAGVDREHERGVLRGLARTRVRVLLDAGRVEEAARRLEAASGGTAGDELEVAVLRARVAVASAPPLVARRDAEAVLARLHAGSDPATPPGTRVRAATELAASARTRPELADVGARAYDAAAGAAVERLAELEAFVRDTPEAATPTPDDLRLLDAMRVRLLAEHAELGRALVRLHASGPDRAGHLARLADRGTGFVCVCAWCQRVRTRDGAWLSVQQFLPLAARGPLEVTHGMCDACHRTLDVAVDGAAPRA